MHNKMRQLLQLIIDNQKCNTVLRAEAAGSRAAIYMDGVIDPWFGITAQAVSQALEEIGGADVDIYLNSPGGDVFEGRAIQSRLKRYSGKVTVHIDGLAASAATTVALGADHRIIAEGAFWMIHNSWTLGFGDRNDLRKTADLLEQIDDAIGSDYAAATGEKREQIVGWMDDETWFNAADAKRLGFVHEVYSGDDSAAAKNRSAWNLAAYKNAPKALTERPAPTDQFQARERLGQYVDMLERIG